MCVLKTVFLQVSRFDLRAILIVVFRCSIHTKVRLDLEHSRNQSESFKAPTIVIISCVSVTFVVFAICITTVVVVLVGRAVLGGRWLVMIRRLVQGCFGDQIAVLLFLIVALIKTVHLMTEQTKQH